MRILCLLLLALTACGVPGAAAPPASVPSTEAELVALCGDVGVPAPRAGGTGDGPAHATAAQAYGQGQADFGGLWLDQEQGGLLHVAFTADHERHETELRALLGGGAAFRIVPVTHTEADLTALQRQVDFGVVGRSPLWYSTVDVVRNRVELGVEAVDDEARALLAQRYGTGRVCITAGGGPPADVPPGGGAPGVAAIPTSLVRNPQEALLPGVTLAGDGTCVWVEDAGGAPTAVRWPPGYGARFLPDGVELVDERGAVVARPGEVVDLGGGYTDGPLDRCQVGAGEHFSAGSVEGAP